MIPGPEDYDFWRAKHWRDSPAWAHLWEQRGRVDPRAALDRAINRRAGIKQFAPRLLEWHNAIATLRLVRRRGGALLPHALEGAYSLLEVQPERALTYRRLLRRAGLLVIPPLEG